MSGAPVNPFEAACRETIARQLRAAAARVENAPGEGGEPLREMLEEALDRLDALETVHEAAGGGTAVLSRWTCSTLATVQGEPVREFLLIPFGEVGVESAAAGGSFVFTRRHAASAVAWFERMDRKLAIDYEHQSLDRLNTRADGLRPAAGWIGGLEVRADGLWATEVDWTERAAMLLRSGEYRYFSPVIYWTDEDYSDVAALGPVALTNDPAMHGVSALAARRSDAEAPHEDAGLRTRVDEPDDGEEEELVPREQLEEARAEAALLRRRLAGQAADLFVERGLRAGKIVDSTSMDWRDDYLRDAEAAELRLSRAPVLLPPGRVMRLDRRGEPLPLEGEQRAGELQTDICRRWGVEPADLEAYERANAAGRVRIGAGV